MSNRKAHILIIVIIVGVLSCTISTAQDTSDNSAEKMVEQTTENIKAQKGYRIKFSAVTDIPHSDSLKMEGTIAVINPDIVYVNFEGSGGQKIKVIRKGKNILMEDVIANEWVDPAEMGEGGVGRGIQDPETLLDIMNKHSKNATLSNNEKVANVSCKVVDLNFKGTEIKDVLSEQPIDTNTIEWDSSSLSAKLWIGEKDLLLYKVEVAATLISNKEEIKGKINYTAHMEITNYNDNIGLEDVPKYAKDELGIK